MAARTRARPRPRATTRTTKRASSRSTSGPTDHKMIAMQYMFTGMFMALIGGFFAYVFRMQHGVPGHRRAGLRPRHPGRVQRAGHQPRHDHDLLGRDAGADRRVRELPDPADDRLRRHGVPAASTGSRYQIFLLSAIVLLASFFVPGRRLRRRLDGVPAAVGEGAVQPDAARARRCGWSRSRSSSSRSCSAASTSSPRR